MATMLEMAREVIRYDFYDPPTVDGPRWEIAYAQEVLRVCAKQHVQTTGMFDSPTCAAVKSVQRFFGQTADGLIGPKLWGLLHYLAKTKTRP